MNQWVVTYRIVTEHHVVLTEFYRGSKRECLRIQRASTGVGEDDRQRTKNPWIAIVGTAKSWEQFIEENF